MSLKDAPGLASSTLQCVSTGNDDRAAQVEGVCLAAGEHDSYIVQVAPGEVRGNIPHMDDQETLASTNFGCVSLPL